MRFARFVFAFWDVQNKQSLRSICAEPSQLRENNIYKRFTPPTDNLDWQKGYLTAPLSHSCRNALCSVFGVFPNTV